MAQVHKIKISPVETVHVELLPSGHVKLSICMGSMPLVSKCIEANAARLLGDALGYAYNDAVRPPA